MTTYEIMLGVMLMVILIGIAICYWVMTGSLLVGIGVTIFFVLFMYGFIRFLDWLRQKYDR